MGIIEIIKRFLGFHDIVFTDSLGCDVVKALMEYKPKRIYYLYIERCNSDTFDKASRIVRHVSDIVRADIDFDVVYEDDIDNSFDIFLYREEPYDTFQVTCVGGEEMKRVAQERGFSYHTTEDFIAYADK